MELIIKSIFDSVQGEGDHIGLLNTFIRLAGCSVNCPIKNNCDTDYNNGQKMGIDEIISKVNHKVITITGGEPLEQNIYELVRRLSKKSHSVHIQTSGMYDISDDLFSHTRHVVCSPKASVDKLKLRRVDEVKVVYYGQDVSQYYCFGGANSHYLQPYERKGKYNISECIREIRRLSDIGQKWQLGIQMHKFYNLS